MNRVMARAEQSEREHLNKRFPVEFKDGVRCALLHEYPGPREVGGYPLGFHNWPLDRRNSWWSGFNFGLSERKARESEAAHGRS